MHDAREMALTQTIIKKPVVSAANEQLGGCFQLMPHKTCLKMVPTAEFAALSAMVGAVYAGYAIANNKITQAESAW